MRGMPSSASQSLRRESNAKWSTYAGDQVGDSLPGHKARGGLPLTARPPARCPFSCIELHLLHSLMDVLLDVADGSVCDTPFAPERVPLTGRHLGGAFVDGGSSRVAHSRDLCCHLGHAEIRSPALLWVGAIDGFGHSLAPSTFHRSEMTTSPPLGRRWVISTRGTGDAAEVRRPIDSSAMRMTS
jgi:hypothetical protein